MDDDVMSSAASYRSGEEAERTQANQAPAGKFHAQPAKSYAQPADTAEAPMSNYRLYCLSGEGRIGFADWIEAASDIEAIGKVHELRPDANKCEVWHENRLVAQIRSDGHLEPVAS